MHTSFFAVTPFFGKNFDSQGGAVHFWRSPNSVREGAQGGLVQWEAAPEF